MKRSVVFAGLAFVASLIFAPAAVAQEDHSLQAQDTPQEDVAEEFMEEILENPEQVEPVREELQEAQQEAELEQQAGVPEPAEVEDQQPAQQPAQQQQSDQQKGSDGQQKQKGGDGQQKQQQMPKQMPKTGGVELNSLLLPATVLLVGTGVMAAYGIRRYRR